MACFFVPPLIHKIGPKYAMIIGGTPYVLMVGATLRPSWYLSLPMNILVGLGAPLLWTGVSVYLGRFAMLQTRREMPGTVERDALFAKRVGELSAKFTSVFFMFFQGNGTFGLVTASTLLHIAGTNGIKYLFILLVLICAMGVVLLCTLPQAKTTKSENSNKGDVSNCSWRDTIYLAFTDPQMTLMIPFIFYNGLSLGFLFGDFTSIVLVSSVSLQNTGFVMAIFYAVNALVSYIAGSAAIGIKRLGRTPYLMVASLSHAAFFVFLLIWDAPKNYVDQCSFNDCVFVPNRNGCTEKECTKPYGPNTTAFDHDQKYTLMIDAPNLACWLILIGCVSVFAIGDAVWESFPQGIVQYFYSNDDDKLKAGSANNKMWQSLGFAVQFVLGVILSDDFHVKLIILLFFLGLGVVSLIYLHVHVRNLDVVDRSEGRREKGTCPNYDPISEGRFDGNEA